MEDDRQNALIYEAGRDRSVADTVVAARSSWDRLVAAVDACSETDLQKPHPYATGRMLWESVAGTGHAHTGDHLMFWYLESGDEASAEAAQVWVRDLLVSVASDPKRRSNASYNLACFYGRVGRADRAVPLLRDSFISNPALVAVARNDRDLDPIRNDRRLAELLAG